MKLSRISTRPNEAEGAKYASSILFRMQRLSGKNSFRPMEVEGARALKPLDGRILNRLG